MKYIAKMMLALLASITLAVPAFAWDWSASGSAGARFYNGELTPATANDNASKGNSRAFNDMDHSGSIALGGSHTDGDTSVTFKLALDDDDGAISKNWSISGSQKAGIWTASASYTLTEYQGTASDSDDTDTGDGSDGEASYVSLTDGTITYKLGKAGHIGCGAKGASVSFYNVHTDTDSAWETGPGCRTGSFDGFSVGYAVNDTTSVTFGIQMDKNAKILNKDGWNAQAITGDAGSNKQPWQVTDSSGVGSDSDNVTWSSSPSFNTMGYGLNVATNAGGADIGFTYTSGSIACDGATTGSDDAACKDWSVSHSGMTLGVSMDMGGLSPFLTVANQSYSRATGTGADNESSGSAQEMALGVNGTAGDISYSVVYNSGSAERKSGSSKTDNAAGRTFLGGDNDASATGLTISASQSIGGATITYGYSTSMESQGYGATNNTGTFGKRSNGRKLSVYGAKLAYSF